jgi:amidase
MAQSVLTGRSPASRCDVPPKIGLCRTHLWESASPESQKAVNDAAARLASDGAKLRDVCLPGSFDALSEARSIVNPVERSRSLAHEWNTNRALISPGLSRQIEEGLRIPYARYVQSLQRISACRDQLPDVFGDADVLLAPSVAGEAPKGLDNTGDPKLQELWTALHVPTITLPTHTGPHGLPIGIQLVARHYDDETLLSTARWVFATLGAWRAMEHV